MSTVDELFSGKAPAPVVDRARGLRWRIALAMLLNLSGPVLCITSVPGAVLSLWSWGLADEELQRVENGALPPERRGEILALRGQAFRTMTMAFVLMLVQITLWLRGDYAALIQAIGALVTTLWANAMSV